MAQGGGLSLAQSGELARYIARRRARFRAKRWVGTCTRWRAWSRAKRRAGALRCKAAGSVSRKAAGSGWLVVSQGGGPGLA